MKTKTTRKTKKKGAKKTRIPYHRKPDNMSLENWQIALRRQFGEDSTFEIVSTASL